VSGGSRIGGALTCCSCQEHGLEYKSVGWWKGNAEILHSLHKAALKARSTKVVSFQESLLWAGMNAEG